MMNTMGEVATLTDKLAMMPDNMLPRLAQQYKSDAITLSLILGEKNRRDRMRNSTKMQAVGQPQPKVNDVVVAGMQQLPEETGIGALPAPNMQRMADGGIAGYDDDNNLAYHNEPVMRMAEGGVARYQVGGVTPLSYGTEYGVEGMTTGSLYQQAVAKYQQGKPLSDVEKALLASATPVAAVADTAMLPITAFRKLVRSPLDTSEAPSWFPLTSAATSKLASEMPPQASYSNEDRRVPFSGIAQASGTGKNAPKADTTGKGNLPDLTAAKTDVPTTALSAPRTLTAAQAKEQAKQFSDFGPAKDELQAAKDTAEASAAKMREILASGLPKTPALEGLEKLLDKQEAETGGEKEKAAGLALLTAGLAIAGGSSRFALQNLKEAIPAVTQYGDALKDIKKMERENMKMRGEIEQARRAEARDDMKLKLQLEEKIADRREKINELGIGLTSKIADTDARTATTLWTTSQEVASRERTAGASANAQLNLFRQLGEAPAGSPLRKGFELYKQEGAEPTMYANYVKLSSDPMTGEAFLKKYPTFEVYKAGMGGQGQFYSGNDVIPAAVRTR